MAENNQYKEMLQGNKSSAPEKKVEKGVVKGSLTTKKKTGVSKFTDVFISVDAANVKSYILMDVLVPAVKKAISDIVRNGIDMILYGESGGSKRSGSASKISYRAYYDRENNRDHRSSAPRAKTGIDYDDILFDTRGDAEVVLNEMQNVIEQYGFVSVGNLYDLADVSTENYSLNKYGWTSLSSARVVPTRDGYVINLPRACPIN